MASILETLSRSNLLEEFQKLVAAHRAALRQERCFWRMAGLALARCLLRETLAHVGEDEWYVVGTDATQIPRSSQRMPVRTAKNRVLSAYLPPAERLGRRKYGARLSAPEEWMRQ